MGISEAHFLDKRFFLDAFTHWWSTEEIPPAKCNVRELLPPFEDYSLIIQPEMLKNSCKMYILLFIINFVLI